ncbi:regulator of protease activity HflC (stomatin/prohibitin superfamily) [Spirosoma oryzae]|uniref:Regulator of protease activity HflC (Stomatin/prohibitin superfamily) n=1 Tax=Spirosoma oryzae TaxID=1469603 RepID=A0A2T0SQ10_9BACT|nr:prohibitin family protein [Spirosoma oryzae]PRY35507.1 regulator of protease activity HflC (stomatin/prohibitin superfamily) [Spirosoma oryzae]
MKRNLLYLLTLSVLSSCTIIRQGEVGVKRRLGKLDPNVKGSGVHGYNPLTTTILRVPIRTINLPLAVENLPSKEGLNISAEMAVLYRIVPEKAPQVLATIGERYENVVVVSVFRSAAADVCARFFAKDMYTGQREEIEREIADEMHKVLEPRGIVVESVLMKSIELPKGLAQSIEQKLEAEQQAQQMDFVLQKERKEADRKVIEAKGIADAQKIISEGLTKQIIEFKSIEAFRQLATSPNTKVIVTDGKTPMLISSADDK